MKKLPFIFLLPLLSTVSVAKQLDFTSFRPHIPTPYEVGYEMERGRIRAMEEARIRKEQERLESEMLEEFKKAFEEAERGKARVKEALVYAKENLPLKTFVRIKKRVRQERLSGKIPFDYDIIAKRIIKYTELELAKYVPEN